MQLDDKMRETIALKKFSIVAPVLNGQIPNQKSYFTKICEKPIELPYYGSKSYTPKTLQYWASSYLKDGIDALKPGYRSDKGKHRKIGNEILQRVKEIKSEFPKMQIKLIYETLVAEGTIASRMVSLSTFYRFMEDIHINKELLKDNEEKDLKRFSHEFINELWQTDTMYGPYIRMGKSKKQTYLLAYIDDASRLITHGEFYFSQSFNVLRSSFKDAIMKRGVPKMLYTDNGKIYRSQQLEYICASIGCSLIHTKFFSPYQKGKIERFFNTVRTRFLSRINPTEIKDIEELNVKFREWLDSDYQRKTHSSLSMSPLDLFMSQVSRINIFNDINYLNECFLVRVSRKINNDATLQLDNILYETEQKFSGERLEIRYDPEMICSDNSKVFLYREGIKVGEAIKINFKDNAHVKRRYNGNRRKTEVDDKMTLETEAFKESTDTIISYSELLNEGVEA